MSTAYRVKQCWCGWCSRVPHCAKLTNLCMHSKNGLLNCFKTINLHHVGAFVVMNMMEGGFVESTDKLFGIPDMFMEISRLKLYVLAV